MGNDGGSIPHRAELVKTRAATGLRSEATDAASREAWFTCALSAEPLRPPVVACARGRLYNKEAVLSALLLAPSPAGRGALPPHVRGMRDLVTLVLQAPANNTKMLPPTTSRQYHVCPLSARVMNGGPHAFVYHSACGHVVAAAALAASLGAAPSVSWETHRETPCAVCGAEPGGPLRHCYIMLNPATENNTERNYTLRRIEALMHTSRKKRPRSVSNDDQSKDSSIEAEQPKLRKIRAAADKHPVDDSKEKCSKKTKIKK